MASGSNYLSWGGDSWSVPCAAPEMRGFTRAEVGGGSSGGSSGGSYSYSWDSSDSGRPYGAYLPPGLSHGGVLAPDQRGLSRPEVGGGTDVSFTRREDGTERRTVMLNPRIVQDEVGLLRSFIYPFHWMLKTGLDSINAGCMIPDVPDLEREAAEAIMTREDRQKAERLREMIDKGEVLGDMSAEDRAKMTLCSREPEKERELDNDVTHRGDRYDAVKQGTIIYRHDIDRMVYTDKDGNVQSMAHPSDREWMDQFAQVYAEAKHGEELDKSSWIDRCSEQRRFTSDDAKSLETAACHALEAGISYATKDPVGMAKHTIEAVKSVGEPLLHAAEDAKTAFVECRADAVRDGYSHLSDYGFQ